MENHIGKTTNGVITDIYISGALIKTVNQITGKLKLEDIGTIYSSYEETIKDNYIDEEAKRKMDYDINEPNVGNLAKDAWRD